MMVDFSENGSTTPLRVPDTQGEPSRLAALPASTADDAGAAPDPFDVSRLRLPPDDDAALGLREMVVAVPVRKPTNVQFIRVYSNPDYQCYGGIIEMKDDREYYWVAPALWPHMAHEPTFTRRRIVTAVTRQGAPFLWPLRLPGPDGKTAPWVTIPAGAAKAAETRWTKLWWDPVQKLQRVTVSDTYTDEPEWPTQPFTDLLKAAFDGWVIDSLDHPLLKKLRGEA